MSRSRHRPSPSGSSPRVSWRRVGGLLCGCAVLTVALAGCGPRDRVGSFSGPATTQAARSATGPALDPARVAEVEAALRAADASAAQAEAALAVDAAAP